MHTLVIRPWTYNLYLIIVKLVVVKRIYKYIVRTADHILEISKQGAFNANHILEGNVMFTRF